jgi:hypothetical protein
MLILLSPMFPIRDQNSLIHIYPAVLFKYLTSRANSFTSCPASARVFSSLQFKYFAMSSNFSKNFSQMGTYVDSQQSFDFHTRVFSSGPTINVPRKRKRKNYAPERRQEVAAVRRVGACGRCRVRKVRVGCLLIQ